MALAKRKGKPAGNRLNGSQFPLYGLLKFNCKHRIVQRHQPAGFRSILGPDNGAEMVIAGFVQQRQKRQRPGQGKPLPGRKPVALAGSYRGHNGLLIVIPFPRRQADPLTQAGIGAITTNHQRGRHNPASLQLEDRVIARSPAPGYGSAIDQFHLALRQGREQGPHDAAVLDNGAQGPGLELGRVKLNAAGAVAIPNGHGLVGTMATGGNIHPHPELLQKLLTGHRDGADPRLKVRHRGRRIGRLNQRLAIKAFDEAHLPPLPGQTQRQCRPDHTSAGHQNIEALRLTHGVSLPCSVDPAGLWLPAGRPAPWLCGQTSVLRRAEDPDQPARHPGRP